MGGRSKLTLLCLIAGHERARGFTDPLRTFILVPCRGRRLPEPAFEELRPHVSVVAVEGGWVDLLEYLRELT